MNALIMTSARSLAHKACDCPVVSCPLWRKKKNRQKKGEGDINVISY